MTGSASMRVRLKKSLPWVGGVALAVVAGVLTATTPTEDSLRAPFLAQTAYEPGGSSSEVTARSTTTALLDAAFADRVTAAGQNLQTDGHWLVVTIAASAPLSEVDAAIELAALHVGDEVFHASERVDDSLLGTPLHVGIDTVGMLAFELPDDVRSGEARLELSAAFLTPRLDDVTAFTVPLGDVRTASEIEIAPPEASP